MIELIRIKLFRAWQSHNHTYYNKNESFSKSLIYSIINLYLFTVRFKILTQDSYDYFNSTEIHLLCSKEYCLVNFLNAKVFNASMHSDC